MSKLLNTYAECDIHIDNMIFMHENCGYVPVYYQVSLMKALAKAQEGIVLYFFQELGKRSPKILCTYFGSPIQCKDEPRMNTGNIRNLKKLLS